MDSPNTVHAFCLEQVGRIEVRIFGAQVVNSLFFLDSRGRFQTGVEDRFYWNLL